MWFLSARNTKPVHSACSARQRFRLHLEALENRTVLTAAADLIPDQWIVVLKPNVDATAYAEELRGQGREILNVFAHGAGARGINGVAIHGAAPGKSEQIAYVEQDQVVQALGKPTPPPQVVPTGVARMGADKNPIAHIGDGIDQRVDVDIAIIDTGIDLSHPDLNVVANVSFVPGPGGKTRSGDDDNGHGTHVAGIAAALDNGIGVVGVAPGARLTAVKVLNSSGSGAISTVIAGVNWVADHASTIEVANMSLGGAYSQALNDAVAAAVAKGVVFTVAAGNAAADAANSSPASAPDAITVSALADSDGKPGGLGAATSYGPDDTLATFSNYGSVVDVAAPGVAIYSTYAGGGYATMSGTSMAAPHVAGAAALYIAQFGRATNAASVNAISNALKAASQPMDLWRPDGIDVASDKDATHEGLAYVSGDVALTSFAPTPNVATSYTLVVANQGLPTETVTVTLTDGTSMTAMTVANLQPGETRTLVFTWNGTGTLKATASAVFGEADVADNVLTCPLS